MSIVSQRCRECGCYVPLGMHFKPHGSIERPTVCDNVENQCDAQMGGQYLANMNKVSLDPWHRCRFNRGHEGYHMTVYYWAIMALENDELHQTFGLPDGSWFPTHQPGVPMDWGAALDIAQHGP